MEQQNNITALTDSAGVLPMDTGAIFNGIHDENASSSVNAGQKKGRGRPPKATSAPKPATNSSSPKRGRGRPSKTGGTSSAAKTVAVAKPQKEEPSTDADANKKKRGRPSKSSTLSEQTNGISKPQVHVTPVASNEDNDSDEPAKRKRGRPAAAAPSPPKQAVVVAKVSALKEASPARKRGRPSGTGSAKKSVSKAQAPTSADGSARKRGRPKKAAGNTTAAATTSSNESATTSPINA
ncbi:unnamed protein product [Rotaria magnacalcarata]|uniref:Uncharacterized protein n=1 Tax=Rotaria magnacalcarata TaxID=392030 RepID=A0A819R3H8_9BILA|nr:unnamed protein product [Rotaria magnacalcarata]CAF2135102.1 unnamed protein product [Rotaria magnacalcarata]CAF4041193.1 unnamed protein product [Rotaria magnacalcarata]CAF4380029.1 unnamed protein product [Rotaria magnacalcarata]